MATFSDTWFRVAIVRWVGGRAAKDCGPREAADTFAREYWPDDRRIAEYWPLVRQELAAEFMVNNGEAMYRIAWDGEAGGYTVDRRTRQPDLHPTTALRAK